VTRLFSAAILSALVALSGTALAQGSGSGTPNTLHGSGDMMQDGPHATANPYASATGNSLPSGRATSSEQSRKAVCEKKWREARMNGTGAGVSHVDFISACRSSF
jgi:hypothetical protein